MNVLTDQIVREALKWIGTRGESPSDGEQVRIWLSRVGRESYSPWSAAFVWCMLDDACAALGMHNPIEPCGGVQLLFYRAGEKRARVRDVGPGYIFGIDRWPEKNNDRLAHCGIVFEAGTDGECRTVEGPISLISGLEGSGVEFKTRMASEFTLGCIDPVLLFV